MAYVKQNYQPGDVLTAEQVNKMQDVIIKNEGNIDSHIEDKNNPHGVTIAQIGAAPAGYGLGVSSPSWCPNRDCDQAVLSGWYRVSSSNDANNPGQSGVMFVSRYSDACIYQTFYGYSSTAPIKMRSNFGTGFGEWEWVNPPMNLGVEYLTIEKWNGKAVYTKLVSVGALPNNSSKTVATGATASGIFRTHLIVYAAEGNVLESPYFTSDGTLKIKHNVSNNGVLSVYTTDDYSGATGYCQIWYTKD